MGGAREEGRKEGKKGRKEGRKRRLVKPGAVLCKAVPGGERGSVGAVPPTDPRRWMDSGMPVSVGWFCLGFCSFSVFFFFSFFFYFFFFFWQ